MTERRQKIRGTTAQLDQVIGVEGLLAYDTTLKEFRGYDGILQGGYRIPNLLTIDAAYKLPDRLKTTGKTLAGIDVVTVTEAGFYYTDATTIGLPTAAIGTLLVEPAGTGRNITWTRRSTYEKWGRSFDGVSTWTAWQRIVDLNYLTTNAAAKAYDADRLDGQDSLYYRDASNINAGTLNDARLPGTMSAKIFTGGTVQMQYGTAVTPVEHLRMVPTDFAAGKYGLFFNRTTQSKYTISMYDGVNNNGQIDFAASSLTWNNVTLATMAGGAFTGNSSFGGTLGITGNLTASTATFSGLVQANSNIAISNANPRILMSDTTAGSDDFWLYVDTDTFYLLSDRGDDGSWDSPFPATWSNASNGFQVYGSTVWRQDNDGAGSGLDADLLDGQDGSYYTNIVARLGYTPVRQGGGAGQGTNTVFIGWGGSSQLLLQVDSTNFGASWPIWITGQAGTSRYLKQGGASGGTDMQFNWSGQGGQPNWLWGGNDGVQHYVYNPANFNVNYANGAGNADTVDGIHGTAMAQFHTGGGAADTSLPIGAIVLAYSNAAYALNSAVAVYLNTASTAYYTLNSSAGTQLSGTWRNRGTMPYSSGNHVCVIQRTG